MAGNDDDSDGIQGWGASADHDPSPIPGMDWQTFRNFVGRALNGDETVPAAIRTRVNAALHDGETDLGSKDRRWWQDFVLRQAIEEQLRKIDNLIDRYSQMAAWHHAQAEQARARMVEAAGKLEGIDDFLKEADDVLSATNKTGKLDRERMLKLLKTRSVSVDADEDAESIIAKLNAERFKSRQERIKWSDRYDHAHRDADYHDDQETEDLRKAEELVQKRDAIRSGGHAAEEEHRLLEQVTDEYENDVRRKAFELEKRNNKIADGSIMLDAQRDINNSQTLQSRTEASDFESLAGTLTGKFQTVAANTVKDDPSLPPPVPNGPTRSGPATSV